MTKPILLLLNKVLSSNEGSKSLLAKNHGKKFRIIVPIFSLNAIIGYNGLLDNYDGNEFDTIIKVPFSVFNYLINKDKLALIKQIDISGDKNFGLFILEVLSKLNWNIIDYDNIPGGILVAKTISSFFLQLKNQFQLISGNAVNSVHEYLLYETEDLVTHFEMNDFCHGVDELNNRTDILKAKINLLLHP